MKLFSGIYNVFPILSIKRKVEKDLFLSQEARERGLIEEADKIEAHMKRRISSYAERADQRMEYRFLGYACVFASLLLILLLLLLLYPFSFIALFILLLIAIPFFLIVRIRMNSKKRSYFSDSLLYEEEKKRKEQSEKNMRQGFQKGLFTWNPAPSSSEEIASSRWGDKKEKAHIILRPAEESDRTYIARLNFLTDVFGDENAELSSEFLEDARYYVNEWSTADGGFIAFDDQGIPAGGVWLRWGEEGWGTSNRHGYGHYRDGYPELAIAVENRYQGSGVGTRLLKAAIDFARESKAPGISLCVDRKNPRAHRLYKKLGFREHTFLEEHGLYVLFMTFEQEDTSGEEATEDKTDASATTVTLN